MRILSKRFSPVHMERVLGEFLGAQRAMLVALPTAELQDMCESLVKSLQDPPSTYTEESSRHWESLVHDMPFDWTQQVIAQLQALTHLDLLAAADGWLFDAQQRRSVSVMLFGNTHLGDLGQLRSEMSGGAAVVESDTSGTPLFFDKTNREVLFSLEELTEFKNKLEYGVRHDRE